jgi:hypothetical protein
MVHVGERAELVLEAVEQGGVGEAQVSRATWVPR